MQTTDSNKNLRNAAIYVGAAMVIVYLFIGIALIFTPAFSDVLGEKKTAIGYCVLLYALYRAWLTYRLVKIKKDRSRQ
jgi:hypothetical protein